jgi:hypothetical protein
MRSQFKSLQITLTCCLFAFLFFQNSPCLADDIDGYQVTFEANPPHEVISALKRQLEICDKAPVSARLHAFFKSMPIILVPAQPGQPARYGNGRVIMFAREFARNKPILLHEMLHGVHNQLIPNGVENQDIYNFYLKAKELFTEQDPDNAEDYFLKNQKEFFAVTGSIYLFGDIPRPPYSIKNIQRVMPGYVTYLQNLFASL